MQQTRYLLLWLLALPNLAWAQTPTFAAPVTYSTGSASSTGYNNPYDLLGVDLNRDGKPDLLVANSTDNSVGVLLGTGSGTFQTARTYSAEGNGNNPVNLAVADLNADGKPDVVTGNTGRDQITVFLGNGDGSLQSAVSYSPGSTSRPQGVAIADVNGDRIPDILTANSSVFASGNSSVGVLFGTGNGKFQTAVNYPTGSGTVPNRIVVADVSGDGQLDLLTANNNGSVSVLLGNGTGTFRPTTNYAVSGSLKALALADVDGDGLLDVLAANTSANAVSVLLGTGTGTFRTPTNYTTGSNSSPYDVKVADVNGDGRLDLLAANSNYASNSVAVLLGNGNGTFQAPLAFGGGSNTYSQAVSVVDVNGDSRPDILVANTGILYQSVGSASVLLNTTPITLTALNPTSGPVGTSVMLTGTNLSGATGVSFNGKAATTFSVVNSMTVTATVPTGATSGNVTVTTPGGTSNGVAFTVQTNAPVVLTPANNSYTNRDITLSGTAPANSTVTLYLSYLDLGATTILTTTATSAGTFSQGPFSIIEGRTQVYATAQSTGAAVSANSNTNTFVVDRTAPTVTLNSASGTNGGITSSNPLLSTATFSEAVTSLAASGLSVTNGTVSSGPTAGSGNTYTFQVTPTTLGTATTVQVRAGAVNDLAGNGNAASNSYALTSQAPTIVVAPATLPNGTVGAAYSQTFSASGGTASYSFAVINGTLPNGLSLSSTGVLAGTPTAGGSFTFTVTATDASTGSGPYSGARAYTVTIAAQPVTAAPVLTAPANNSVTNSATPTFSGTAPAGSTVTVYLAASGGPAQALGTTTAPGGNFSFTPPTALADGTYQAYAAAQSSSAAASANSNIITFTVDTTAPTVTLSSSTVANGGTTSTAPVSFTASFSEPVTGLSSAGLQVSGGAVTSGPTAGAGNAYAFQVTPSGAGPVAVQVRADAARDQASNGNAASAPFNFTYLLPCQAPTNVAVSQVNFTSATVSFTASATASGGYVVSYTPSGGSAKMVPASASPVQLTGLTPNTSYTVSVASQCSGGLTATSTPPVSFTTPLRRVPENPSGTTAGLMYQYYEASGANFTSLPTFASLTPKQTGTTAGFDEQSLRQRSYGYALRFTGYITVPQDGDYTFFTNSDDGSQLFIGEQLVVDNDGDHGVRERSSTIGLQAGTHALTVTYYQDGGPDQLSVSYQGPGLAKQLIPTASLRVVLPTALRTPENPSGTTAGLLYQYYEAAPNTTYTSLPNFAASTPKQSGATATIDVKSQRQRATGYALRYTGYVTVPADGIYSFYTNSDDGSQLFIGSTLVVDNDGDHGVQERTGSIGLQAGTHTFTVTYYQNGGDDQLSVSYQGPGVSKQVLPAARFSYVPAANPLRAPENPSGTQAGLRYQYYESTTTYSQLPTFAAETVRKSGTTTNFDERSLAQRSYGYALQYTGYVTVPADGQYTFFTNSDDGSQLFIGSALVVDNDGNHDVRERSGTIGLQAGTHLLTVTYYQDGGGDQLSVSYQGPGVSKQAIPAASLRYVPASSTSSATRTLLATTDRAGSTALAAQAYPNPFTSDVTLTFNLPQAGAYSLAVYDVTGRLVEQLPGGTAAAGEPQQRTWAAARYASGLYLLRLSSAGGTQQLRLTKQ